MRDVTYYYDVLILCVCICVSVHMLMRMYLWIRTYVGVSELADV